MTCPETVASLHSRRTKWCTETRSSVPKLCKTAGRNGVPKYIYKPRSEGYICTLEGVSARSPFDMMYVSRMTRVAIRDLVIARPHYLRQIANGSFLPASSSYPKMKGLETMTKNRFDELLDKIETGERQYYPARMTGSKQERGAAPNGGREIAFKSSTQSGRHPGVWDKATVTPASVTEVGDIPLDKVAGPALFAGVVGVEAGPDMVLVDDPEHGVVAVQA